MKFLINERAWKRWSKLVNRSQPTAPISAPVQYPCFGYLVVASYSYEEERALYLYSADIERMREQVSGRGRRVGCAACDRGDFQLGHHHDCPKKKK